MQILTQYQQIHADTSTYLHSCPALQFQLEVCQCGVTSNSPGNDFRASAYHRRTTASLEVEHWKWASKSTLD